MCWRYVLRGTDQTLVSDSFAVGLGTSLGSVLPFGAQVISAVVRMGILQSYAPTLCVANSSAGILQSIMEDTLCMRA